jgi:hypothetical protein
MPSAIDGGRLLPTHVLPRQQDANVRCRIKLPSCGKVTKSAHEMREYAQAACGELGCGLSIAAPGTAFQSLPPVTKVTKARSAPEKIGDGLDHD